MTGQLFIVATPIGNLADITYRAVEALRQVDTIAAEDTRTSRKLLFHYNISTPLIPYHEHNEKTAGKKILAELRRGKNIALISDAGTPLISDPGYQLVHLLRLEGIPVISIPGPCSPIAALAVSGLPTDCFTFLGFLPRSGQARQEILEGIATATCTQVLFESPRRIHRTLQDIQEACGPNRKACMARELTKLHEEVIYGHVSQLCQHLEKGRLRGEVVLMLSPAESMPVTDKEIIRLLRRADADNLPPSAKASRIAKKMGVSHRRVYNLLLDRNSKDEHP